MTQMEEEYKRYLLWKAEVDKAALTVENREVMEQTAPKVSWAGGGITS